MGQGTKKDPWTREDFENGNVQRAKDKRKEEQAKKEQEFQGSLNTPEELNRIMTEGTREERNGALKYLVEEKAKGSSLKEEKKEYPDSWYGKQKKELDDRLASIQNMIDRKDQ